MDNSMSGKLKTFIFVLIMLMKRCWPVAVSPTNRMSGAVKAWSTVKPPRTRNPSTSPPGSGSYPNKPPLPVPMKLVQAEPPRATRMVRPRNPAPPLLLIPKPLPPPLKLAVIAGPRSTLDTTPPPGRSGTGFTVPNVEKWPTMSGTKKGMLIPPKSYF